jgi:hypothetical protein
MAAFVYILCAVTCLACCALLFKRYRISRLHLLLWSAIAFLCLTVGNILLFIDFIILPQIDLTLWRNLVTLAGVLVLLAALIYETRGGIR